MIEKREQEQKVKEEERAYIQEKMENKKSNWKESFTNVTVGMKVGQQWTKKRLLVLYRVEYETISSKCFNLCTKDLKPELSQYGLRVMLKMNL